MFSIFKRKTVSTPENVIQGGDVDNQRNEKKDLPKVDIKNISYALEEFRKENEANQTDVPELGKTTSVDEIIAHVQQEDHGTLNKVLLEILSPQLTENEIQKRLFKERLMGYITKILTWQLIFVAIPIAGVVSVSCISYFIQGNNTVELAGIMFDFLKYYITAIIVEFIAMLFFIVKFVFDKSIVDLMGGMLGKKEKRGI